MSFSGWGNLVCFDTEEHQIPQEAMALAKIPKLGSQWKIIHDFKPTEYCPPVPRPPVGLRLFTGDVNAPGSSVVGIVFKDSLSKIALYSTIQDGNNQYKAKLAVKNTQLPKVGEWTRIEIGHEKVEDKYFLSLSVGGKEVGRKEVFGRELRKPTDVLICLGHPDEEHANQPGVIRRLVVLEKQ